MISLIPVHRPMTDREWRKNGEQEGADKKEGEGAIEREEGQFVHFACFSQTYHHAN